MQPFDLPKALEHLCHTHLEVPAHICLPGIAPSAKESNALPAACAGRRILIDRGLTTAYGMLCAEGRMAAGGNIRGKSGLHKATVPGNTRPGQPEGKRHREQTALVRGGKGETVG